MEAAVAGVTDKMVAFSCTREQGEYHCNMELAELTEAANQEKKVPRSWINAEGNGVEPVFLEYIMPLIQGETKQPKEYALPRFAKLKKVLAK